MDKRGNVRANASYTAIGVTESCKAHNKSSYSENTFQIFNNLRIIYQYYRCVFCKNCTIPTLGVEAD
jgi:hypothetical protein